MKSKMKTNNIMAPAIRSWIASMGLTPAQCIARATSPVYGWGPAARTAAEEAISEVIAVLANERAASEAARPACEARLALLAAEAEARRVAFPPISAGDGSGSGYGRHTKADTDWAFDARNSANQWND